MSKIINIFLEPSYYKINFIIWFVLLISNKKYCAIAQTYLI